ncbi:hypothetical protein Tco_0335945 [Tanacetum coccineum]
MQQPSPLSFPQLDSGLVVPSFLPFDDPTSSLNKAMTFLSITFASRYPPTNNQLRNLSNPRNQATIAKSTGETDKREGGYMPKQCTKPKRPKNSTWFKEKMLLTEALESWATFDAEQLAFLADNGDTFTPA